MIDNFAIFLFSSLIVYTIYRAIQLDSERPWFKEEEEEKQDPPPRKSHTKR